MANYDPPYINSNIFNTSYFTDLDGNLTLAAADLRYLKLSGGVVYGLTTFSNSLNVIGTLSINGDAIDLSLISGVVAGTPQNSKALSLDALGKINGDLAITGALSCSQLNVNLTSSGLSWQSIAGSSTIALNHTLNGTALLGSTTNTAFGFLTNNTERVRILNNGNFGIGTTTAGYKLDVNGDINTNTLLRANRTTSGQSFNSTNGTSTCVLYHFNNGDAYFGTSTVNNLVFQTQSVARMTIGSTGAITGISSLTGTTLIASSTLTVNGVDVGSNLAPLVGITLGTPSNSKALTLDASGNINGNLTLTGNLTATNITGTLLTASQPNITSTGSLVITPTTRTLASGNISTNCVWATNLDRRYGMRQPDTNTFVMLAYSAGGAYNDYMTWTAGNTTLSIAGNLSATNLTGTLTTAAQPNITSVGTLTNLTLDMGGTGLNIPALKFDGTTFNQSYYLNITTGSGDALKAIVPNSDKDVSGLRNLSITGAFIASTSIASPSITCNTITGDNGAGSSILNLAYTTLNINGTSMTSTAAELNYVNVSVGISTASKALVMNASNKIGSIGELGFSPLSLLYKTVLRADTSGGAGIEFYDTQFSTPTQRPLINFKTGNNADPIFLRMCGYLSDNDGSGAYPANGCPFTINYLNNVSWDSGLRLGCINQSQASNNGANVGLWARNFTIPHFIAQDRFNQAHIKPTSTVLNSQITGFGIICGDNVCMTGGGVNEMRGNATVLNLHNTTGGTSDRISFTMEHNTTWEMSLGGSAHATVPNGLYWYNGSYKMVLTSAGRLGVGVSSPRCGLEVSGTANYTTISIATNTYIYNVSNNNWANLGGGPVTISICGWFNDDIYVNNSVYTTSDRRMKENITNLDVDIERYKLLKPVSYNYKNQADRTKIGLIAQNVMNVCGEALTFNDNENMTVEEEGDIEGVQMGMDYNAITVLNVDIIKKLISRIEVLEAKLLEKNI